jgi:PAS domain S-box-containing protein
MIVSAVPVKLIDIFGSVLMILLAFLCLLQVLKLKKRDPNNVIWTYLLWLCIALAGFAVSRSVGHIVKQVLLFTDHRNIWESIQPLSGSINTLMFMVAGSVTLFFERSWSIYQQISDDKQALQEAHNELMYLNQNLEQVISERTKALTLSEHKYRRIFEVSRDMILVTKTDGFIIDINPAGYQMLGFKKDSVFSPPEKVQMIFEKPESWENIKKNIEKQGFGYNDEVTLKCQDGSLRRALVSTSVDTGAGPGEDTIHFLIKDIEQRKLMEQQLAQADKLASIGQLSAGIAHEINNPLGIILGYTQMLLREENSDSERHQDLKTIEKHVRTCKSIVEDLLNFARSSRPTQEMSRLNDSLSEVIAFIRHHSKLEDVNITENYDNNLPNMLLDEKKIKQVLMNLIMNAKHAVGRKGTISVSTRFLPDTCQAMIRVSDTGHGIEKKNISRIFDPFFTTKPTGEGTGLGLSVSYGIIKNHGGNIFVESEPGNGTLFSIMLPVIC